MQAHQGFDRDKGISRRDFFKAMTCLGAGMASLSLHPLLAAIPEPMPSIPRRMLGKTGLKVSLLGVGGLGVVCDSTDKDLVEKYLHTAADAGINFFDTAANYGKEGQSEKNLALIMGTPRRKDLILATKCEDRSYDGAMKQVETSLERMKTDRLDIIQVHYVSVKDDVKTFGSATGVLTALRKLRDQKVVNFIGLTGHADFPQVKEALALYDWDTFMCFVNPSRFCRPVFEEQLPLAQKKQMGIIAMKTLGGSPAPLVEKGKVDVSTLLRFAWDSPVHTAIPGMDSLNQLQENIATARTYKPMTPDERQALIAAVNQGKPWRM